MESINNGNIVSKCRVCFQENYNMHTIFKRRKDASIFDKLVSYTKLMIKKNDNGPSLICGECLAELDTTVKFLDKCKRSNDILLSYAKPINTDPSLSLIQRKLNCVDIESTKTKVGFSEIDTLPKVDHISIDVVKGDGQNPCLECGPRKKCRHVQPTFKCEQCGKHFKKKDNLMVHRERHSGERRFSCEECGERRHTRGELVAHLRTHAPRLRPHACPHCSKSFTAHTNLLIHLRRHTGERPHQCPDCHKRFISTTTLTVHRRIHTGVLPYMCVVCGRQFRSNKLARHMRSHAAPPRAAAPRELPCPRTACRRRYKHRQSLNKHLRIHHMQHDDHASAEDLPS